MNTKTNPPTINCNAGIIHAICIAYPDTQAIYLYGTWGTEYQRSDSDLDIAVLLPNTTARDIDYSTWGNLSVEVASAAKVDRIDLVNLRTAPVILCREIIANAEESLKTGKTKIIADHGQIVRVSKDKNGKITRVRNQNTGETEEQWSGDYVFENEWQSFRTRKDRSLELTSVKHECTPGRRKIAVKVVDIFGNDTMNILEVNV